MANTGGKKSSKKKEGFLQNFLQKAKDFFGKISKKPEKFWVWVFVGVAGLLLLSAAVFGFFAFRPAKVEKVVKKAGRPVKVVVQKVGVAEAAEDWSLRYQKHPGNKILDEPLRDTPAEANEEGKSKIAEENKAHILEVSRHDPWVLAYFLEGFGYPKDDIPPFKEMENVKLRKEYWYKLETLVKSSKFVPTTLNSTFYNDGVVGGANPQQTSTPTQFSGIPATEVQLASGEKRKIKNNCGNIQREAPPKKAKLLPPTEEKLPPPEECHDPGNQRHTNANPPNNDVTVNNNPQHTSSTKGYTDDSAEQQAKTEQGSNHTPVGNSGTTTPIMTPSGNNESVKGDVGGSTSVSPNPTSGGTTQTPIDGKSGEPGS